MKKERKTKGWMDLVALIAVLGVMYLAVTFSLGTLRPIGAVVSGSMEPELSRGDLVILRKVAPADIRVGDVAQVEIPRAFQEKFGLPPNTLHRIVDIQQTGNNVQFITKGDANANVDPIPVAPDRIGGVVVGDVPKIGHLFLFLNSPQGRVFAGVMAVAVIGYILYIGISDNWRNVVVAAQVGAGTLPPEAAERALQAGVEPDIDSKLPPGSVSGGPVRAGPPTAAGTPVMVPPGMATADLRLVARVDEERLDGIETGINETRDSLQQFSAAIAEYGTHLQSHTSTVQAMSAASLSLVEAVERQNAVLERLESTLDREAGIARPAATQRRSTRRRRRNTGDARTGPAQSRRGSVVDASVDDRPATASVDRAPRRRVAERRRPTPGAVDFRSALRKVSVKRQPGPRRGG